MNCSLGELPPGSLFRLPHSGREGVVVESTGRAAGRCRVRFDSPDGTSSVCDWSPAAEVTILSVPGKSQNSDADSNATTDNEDMEAVDVDGPERDHGDSPMKLSQSTTTALLTALGAKVPTKATPAKLKAQLKLLAKAEDFGDREIEDEALAVVRDDVAAVLAEGKEVDIVGDEDETEVKAPRKPRATQTAASADSKTKPDAKDAPAKKPKKDKGADEKSGPSNKEVVYKAWKKAGDKADAEKLAGLVADAIKLTTVKSWISSWGRGQNLPACAKE